MKSENTSEPRQSVWWQVVMMVMLLLPLVVLLLMPNRATGSLLGLLFFAIVVFNLVVLWLLLRRSRESVGGEAPAPPRILAWEDIPPVVHEVMEVRSAAEESGIAVFRGSLREAPERAFERLKEVLSNGSVPLLQPDSKEGSAIVLMPKLVEQAALERRSRPWLNWTLFGLTFLTTTWAGALQQGIDLMREPERFTAGLPYSIALLAILGVHELGHYYTARHYKMNVSPPYFIPVPFALGTFGAFIQMRSPPENRRSLFDVAVAGPLAGLVLAIPALFVGLQSSTVLESSAARGEALFGGFISNSILFTAIAKASLGAQLAEGSALHLSPLAFAGWLGLLVTALNLLPIGQLDGGHIARAMFGSRIGQAISSAMMWTLLFLAIFVWPSLLFWAIVVFFLARQGAPPLNDLTPVSSGRRWLGLLSFVILVLILAPAPPWL